MTPAGRKGGGKRIPLLYGARFIVLLAAPLLFGLLQPQPSSAAAPDEPLAFTVHISLGEGDSPPFYGIAFALEGVPISVYESGRAYGESQISDPDMQSSYVFDGRYDATKKTLSGDIEFHDHTSVEAGQEETFDGTLDGVFADDDTLTGTLTGTSVSRFLPGEVDGLTVSGSTETVEVDVSVSGKVEGRITPGETSGGGSATPGPGSATSGGGTATPAPGSKIPGPGSWWQWVTGTVVAGAIASLLSLLNLLFGATPPPVPGAPERTPDPPAPKPGPPVRRPPYVPPADAPRMGPVEPYRETPDGPLVDPRGPSPGTPRIGPEEPHRLDPDGPLILPALPPDATGEPSLLDIVGCALDFWGNMAKDTGGAVLTGTADFLGGTAKTIAKGHAELFGLGQELADDPVGLLGDVLSPWVWGYTVLNVTGEVAESVNPMEELRALADPNMSWEGDFWAISSMATKAANALLLGEGAKDLYKAATRPKQAPLITPEPVGPLDPAVPTPKMSAADAVAAAEKVVGDDAGFKAFTDDVNSALEDLKTKVEAGEDLTPQDMRRISGSDAAKRALKERGTPEAREAFAEKQRQTYDQTDRGVIEELQKEYPGKEITKKEVSSQGQADATKSTDRDVQYLADGEPIPAKTSKAIYNEKYCKAAQVDLEQPTRGIDPERWKKMSPAERQAAYAKQEGQTVIDREHPEYMAELGDNDILPSDPKWTAKVLEDKFLGKWGEGTPEAQVESLEQLRKLGEAAERTGAPMDPRTQAALDIIRDRSLPPAVRDLAVRNLGVPGGVTGLGSKLRSIVEVRGYVPKNAGETLPL